MIKRNEIKNLYTYRTLPIPFGYLFFSAIALALLLTLQEYLSYLIGNYQYDFSWFSITANHTINFLLLVFLSPFASGLSKQLAEKRKLNITRVIILLAASIGIAMVHRVMSTTIYNYAYSWYADNAFSGFFGNWRSKSLGAGIISSLIYFWILIGIFIAAVNRQKLVSKEKELANARLNALITQLRPHFLFNTLNSISSLIDLDKLAAQKMIARFGELLRGVLEKEEKQFVLLKEEIAFIENYLSIESERFSDRLSISYDLDPRSLEDAVPTLILQPLVENAIKHGISKKLHNGKIEISSKILNGTQYPKPQLELVVRDNGKGLVDGFSYGIGLKNISNRLAELYGEMSEFKIENNKGDGCHASIRIPIHQK